MKSKSGNRELKHYVRRYRKKVKSFFPVSLIIKGRKEKKMAGRLREKGSFREA